MRQKTGILLVNLGTPGSSRRADVACYLREFLSDARVLTMPSLFRWLLVNLIIVPFRSSKSAHAYQQIWTAQGSPLMVFSQRLHKKIQQKLEGEIPTENVILAMRYGRPALSEALKRIQEQGFTEILVAPLYPQYASSTTGTVLEFIYQYFSQCSKVPAVKVLAPFFDRPGYIKAVAEQYRALNPQLGSDSHILFSFHGLPESHIQQTQSVGGRCLENNCCENPQAALSYCYRAQCVQTAKLVAENLKLDRSQYSIAFQSRLGRTKWITPYTEEEIQRLAQIGVKRLYVFCPSFVTDCLETLEEINIRGREVFLNHGGKEFYLVPSLNDSELWVDVLAQMMKNLGSQS